MGGVATQTQRFVRRVAGTGAKIYDTRKTIPGLRMLDKYAVRCGGGMNHRIGLFDGLLVKDNHIASIPLRDLASFLTQTITRSKAEDPARFIEVEVDNLAQLREVLKVDGLHAILLDNMDCPTMEQAVALRNTAGKKGTVEMEASGGVTLDTVRQIALTGIERIAVGALTHSALALDVGLDVEDQ
jgi:nicotinate-nucleotide pyrophosphorylase (carboxylating)